MKFHNCLKVCVAEAYPSKRQAKMYREYPRPSNQVWSQCVKEAVDTFGASASEVHCMRRYELRLAAEGRPTVAGMIAHDLVDYALDQDGLPLELIVSAAADVAEELPKYTSPFRFVTDVSGKRLLRGQHSMKKRL